MCFSRRAHCATCWTVYLYLRIVSAACRRRWALLLARIPLHHAWMAIAAKKITHMVKKNVLVKIVKLHECKVVLTGDSEFLVLGPLGVAFPSCLQFSGCTVRKTTLEQINS